SKLNGKLFKLPTQLFDPALSNPRPLSTYLIVEEPTPRFDKTFCISIRELVCPRVMNNCTMKRHHAHFILQPAFCVASSIRIATQCVCFRVEHCDFGEMGIKQALQGGPAMTQ